MLERMMVRMGHHPGERIQHLSKRICGVWLIWVAIVIAVSAYAGGEQKIQNTIFYLGYFAGVVLILGNKPLYRKLAVGAPSRFQKNATTFSIFFMFVLMCLFSGRYFQLHDYRMIWLGALLAIALHFIPFSLVHGKLMILLAIPLTVNALAGIHNPNIAFCNIAYIDALIKLIFGFILVFSKHPQALSTRKRGDGIGLQ